MNFWHWLVSHPIEALSAVLSAATIGVLLWTGKTVKRQAGLLLIQIEQSKAPLLVLEFKEVEKIRHYKIVNRGAGIAFHVSSWEGGLEEESPLHPKLLTQPSTLGPGQSTEIPRLASAEKVTVGYKDIDCAEHWTVVYSDPYKTQQHFVKKGSRKVEIPSLP